MIGRLKRLDLIDGAYVTTRKFLAAFGLGSLRELPDLERLEDEGLLHRPNSDGDLGGASGLGRDNAAELDEDGACLGDGDDNRSADR
jgi:segregation and condensation protein B